MRTSAQHQYIERETCRVRDEKIFGHQLVDFIYSDVRENAGTIFKALTSARITSLLAYFYFDCALGSRISGTKSLFKALGVDMSECVDSPESLDTARKVFERRIRYWETRPMPEDEGAIVSPSDSKMLLGSFSDTSRLFLKDKFFQFEELLGTDKKTWLAAFRDGDFAVFRLTAEKYHYNHTPVAGKILDVYQIPGVYHSCNPEAVITIATPYSKNKRVVTIIDTDVEGGTHAGLVAMVEVVALLIGDIVQCYSEYGYGYPQWVTRGMFVRKGQPKSLYRPGSSTNVLIFQKGRAQFSEDLIENMYHCGARSIFSSGFGRTMVETEVKVRSGIGTARQNGVPAGQVVYGR